MTAPSGGWSWLARLRCGAWLSTWLLAACLLCTSGAYAQDEAAPSAADRAAADALFKQAKQLMAKKEYSQACEKFAASQQLDPGVGTLLFLGDCYEKAERFASAWGAFNDAVQLAEKRGDDRKKIAEVRAAALKPRAPTLTIAVSDSNSMTGFRLSLNGKLIQAEDFSEPAPLDAGDYEVRATAPGHEPWSMRLMLTNGATEPFSVAVPGLLPTPTESEPAAAAPMSAPAAATSEDPGVDAGSESGGSQATWGWVLGGLGATAAIASGVFTALAASKNSKSKDDCDPDNPNNCNENGVALREDAEGFASLATITGIAGGVGITTGLVLILTAPSDESGSPQGAQLSVGGRF